MELNFVASRGPEKASPSILRRQKLVRRIDQQIKFVRDMIGGEVRRASWVWMDEQGTYFVPIKYGRFHLELKKGMFSVQCQNLDRSEENTSELQSLMRISYAVSCLKTHTRN